LELFGHFLLGLAGANVTALEFCSVGGTDYGSVRVGTYMGRKMIKCAASDVLSESEEYEEHGVDLLKSEASMEYLCNLPPHRSLTLLKSTEYYLVSHSTVPYGYTFASDTKLFMRKTFQR
jgi:hypothetical protein